LRLLVCGGRDFTDVEYAVPRIHRAHQKYNFDRLICGMAKGGDSIAYDWAIHVGIPVDEYRPDWKTHGRAAGPLRNIDMLVEGKPDLVIGLPGGNGTAHMCRIAREAGVEVIEYQRLNFSMARDAKWGWCSNFFMHPQHDENGVLYRSNEHWYQVEKTLDPETREWINASGDAATAKFRGRHKDVVIRDDWETGSPPYKITAMMKGLRQKFPEGSELAQKLIDTGDLYLVEYAPWRSGPDRYWGVDAEYKGLNWLGRCLMVRRDELIGHAP
jgi:ribA/ribD-fused uncharacterized protein